MFSTKIQVVMNSLLFLFMPCVKRAPKDRTEERFVNEDNVLIERLIFDLGLRCEFP